MMMQNKIQLVVFLAGILSKASCDLFQIVLIEEQKTWVEAQSYCREKHTDLATVQSDEDRAKLKEAADSGKFQSDAWTGFYRVIWRWSYQNLPMRYVRWYSTEPNDPDTAEACVILYSNRLWHDIVCTNLHYFFCQTDNQDTLQDKFKFIKTSKTWHDARSYCRTHHTDLATITDDTEYSFLQDILSSEGIERVWIGLYRPVQPEIVKIPWQWSDNSSVSLSTVTWESGQPDNVNVNECGRASTDGLMSADTCSTPRPFYCRQNRRIQRVRFTVKSDGHLDESAVKEDIEKRMKQILSDQDRSITWSVQPDEKIFQLQETHENTQETTCEAPKKR